MKYTWISFFLSALMVNLFQLISGINSPYIYLLVLVIVTITFSLTYVSELKINRYWILPINFIFIMQVMVICHMLYISNFGLNLEAESAIPLVTINPDEYQSMALEYLKTGVLKRGGIYVELLKLIYNFFGTSYILGVLFSLCLTYTSIQLFVKTVRIYNPNMIKERNFNKLFVVLLIYPYFVSTSVVITRESVIIYLITASLYYFIQWWQYNNNNKLYCSLLTSLVAGAIHNGVLFLTLAILVIYVLYYNSREKIIINIKSISLLIILFVFSVIVYNSIELGKFDNLDIGEVVLTNKSGTGGSAYSSGFIISNPILSAIINTPVKMFYFWFSPLPNYWRGLGDIVAFMGSSMLYMYVFFSILGEKSIKNSKHKLVNVILSILIIFSIPFAWGVSNAGTAIRHRNKVIVWLLFLLLLYLEKKKENKVE